MGTLVLIPPVSAVPPVAVPPVSAVPPVAEISSTVGGFAVSGVRRSSWRTRIVNVNTILPNKHVGTWMVFLNFVDRIVDRVVFVSSQATVFLLDGVYVVCPASRNEWWNRVANVRRDTFTPDPHHCPRV